MRKKTTAAATFFAIYCCCGEAANVVDSNWTCPGPCWSNPMKTQMSQFYNLWEPNCVGCDEFAGGGCQYGDIKVENEGGCETCIWASAFNRVMGAHNIFKSCDDPGSYTCVKGYYNDSIINAECQPCATIGLPNCPKGTFLKRCVTQQDSSGGMFCGACDNPPLPNTITYKYGYGRVYDDCEITHGTPKFTGPASCAWFLTPKWHRGICDIECNDGYLPVAEGNPPACLKCNTSCSPGWRPPVCLGGDRPLPGQSGDCEKCTGLPPNGHWVANCAWECDAGYYSDGSYCWPCSPTMTCTPPTTNFFMGCRGTQSGQCVACGLVDTCHQQNSAGLSNYYHYYLKTDISMETCACLGCAVAVAGVSYYARNCSARENSEVSLCRTSPCPQGFYAERPCTLWSDVVCTACSSAPTDGLLLLSKCTPLADAVYMACFDGMACNGSATAFQCPNDKVAVKGICKCRPATTTTPLSMGGVCVPLTCPPGMYPDPIANACANCTLDISYLASKAGVIGLEACACPEGFFAQNEGSFIRCWPCGDLGCLRGLQRQSVCDGIRREEPTCNCALAPATSIQYSDSNNNNDYNNNDGDQCSSLSCTNGYFSPNGAQPHAGLYDQFSFLEIPPLPAFVVQQRSAQQIIGKAQDAILMVEYNVSLILSTSGELFALRIDTGEVSKVNLEILIGGIRIALTGVTSILSHEGIGSGGYVWIAFTYWGLCEDVGEVEMNCSAIELVSFQPLTASLYLSSASYCMPDVKICALLAQQSWGKTFSFSGTSRKIQALAFDSAGVNFYLVLASHDNAAVDTSTIEKYKLKFYNANKRIEDRDDDYPLELIGVFPLGIGSSSSSISAGLEGESVFALTNGGVLLRFLLKSKIWAKAEWPNHNNSGSSVILTFNNSLENTDDEKNDNNDNDESGQIFRLSDRLLFIKSADWGLKILDMWNNILSDYPRSEFSQGIKTTTFAFRENMLLGFNDALFVYHELRPCPRDTLVYHQNSNDNGGSDCVPMPCLLAEPCGSNTFRNFGEGICQCLSGYYLSLQMSPNTPDMCLPCPPSFYCPGNGIAIACPPNSISSTAGGESIMDCLCQPGYYHFRDNCILCPTNSWCPVSGTITPVACYASGTTSTVGGSSSPLDCICPERTHGLLCEACGNDEECVLIGSPALKTKPAVPILSVLNVKGLGPIWGQEIVTNCLREMYTFTVDSFIGDFLIYSITDIGVRGNAKANTNNNSVVNNNNDLEWTWILVLRDPTPEMYSNLSICMTKYGFIIQEMSVVGSPIEGNNLRVPQSCGGRNWEWSGSSCVCVGGFEALMTTDWRIQCFPCLNGSVRRPRAAGGCVPCSGLNEHAPYLGMEECVCKEGFKRSAIAGLCINSKEPAPSWYSDLHSSTTVICLAVVLSFVAVALPSAFAYLCKG